MCAPQICIHVIGSILFIEESTAGRVDSNFSMCIYVRARVPLSRSLDVKAHELKVDVPLSNPCAPGILDAFSVDTAGTVFGRNVSQKYLRYRECRFAVYKTDQVWNNG